MRRLVTRLTLSMLALAVVTTIITVMSAQIGFFWHFQSLPEEVKQGVESRFVGDEEGVLWDAFNELPRVLRNSNLIGTALAALVAAAFARYLAKMLANPIEGVSRASMRVAQGDLNVRVPEPETRGSLEVATLSRNFNKMTDALQTYERRDMIASVAHDLRTPLSAMQIRLELLKERVVPYSEAEIDLLLSQTELLGRLVNDLRTLSLANAGKLSLDIQNSS